MLKFTGFFMGFLPIKIKDVNQKSFKYLVFPFDLYSLISSFFLLIQLPDKVYTPQVPKNVTFFYHFRHAWRRYVEFFRDLFGLCRVLIFFLIR